MKMLLAGAVAALGLSFAVPAMAQGIYIGPGGVGVTTGVHPYGYGYGYRYHRDRDRYIDRPTYEGRSVYREHRGERHHDD